MGDNTREHNPQPVRPGPHQDTPDDTTPTGASAVEAFANSIETSFNDIQQSLTNPTTAAVFQRTLDIWERVLQGSHAQHVISDEQLAELTGILNGIREAPNLL